MTDLNGKIVLRIPVVSYRIVEISDVSIQEAEDIKNACTNNFILSDKNTFNNFLNYLQTKGISWQDLKESPNFIDGTNIEEHLVNHHSFHTKVRYGNNTGGSGTLFSEDHSETPIDFSIMLEEEKQRRLTRVSEETSKIVIDES